MAENVSKMFDINSDFVLKQAEKRRIQNNYDKRLIPSGLTTEIYQGEAEYLHQKKLGQQSLLMNKLTDQILKRQQYVDQENANNMAYETQQINDCIRSLDNTRMQNFNDKMRAKKHWELELQRTQNWNSIKS